MIFFNTLAVKIQTNHKMNCTGNTVQQMYVRNGSFCQVRFVVHDSRSKRIQFLVRTCTQTQSIKFSNSWMLMLNGATVFKRHLQ